MRSLITAFLAMALHAGAQTSVLFLGNSYTGVNDLPSTFRLLALSLGDTVVTDMNTPGGYQLIDHATNTTSLGLIASRPWDFVVMQEQSQVGALPLSDASFDIGANILAQAIEANYECTYPVFFMTWGRKNGDATFCPSYPFMCTYAGMQQALRDNYLSVAHYSDGYVSPVGWAWKNVRDTHPSIELYQADESHPSEAGTYLAACTFYCTIFKQSCLGASFSFTLPPDTAAILQAIASATVLDSLDTWNLNVPSGTDAHITGSSSTAWNDVTFYHPGQGQHWWICSNGQSSTDQNPTFTFAGPGIYTFTHVYIDPCGNTDTYTWTGEVYANGLTEITGPTIAVIPTGPAMIQVTVEMEATLTLCDVSGRTLTEQEIRSGSTVISCPSGLLLWTLRDTRGTMRTGRVLVE